MTISFSMKPRIKVAFSALLLSLATTASAEDFATKPLFVGASVDPNLLFILDDSGSMRWGFMPNGLDEKFNIGGTGSNCGNWGYYGGMTLCYYYTNNGRSFLASNYLNKVYFDPAVDYQPPLKADGSRYSNSDFESADFNGYSSSSPTVDLSDNYRAIMDDYYYKRGFGEVGFAVSHNADSEPAFYFSFNSSQSCDDDPYQDSCYQKVVVDASEEQNFANWFSYYRTREMAAKAGIGTIFANPELATSFRLGWGEINRGTNSVDGANVRAVRNGVRPFESVRSDFLDWLYSGSATGATPLRRALEGAGQYYENSDRPWLDDPGSLESSANPARECRISATMLMTDGYYGGSDPSSNVTGAASTDGAVHTGTGGKSGQYKAEAPFSDGDTTNRTLADIAAYYWKRDIRSDIDNVVPTIMPIIDENDDGIRETVGNPAFWQHMMTYGIGLGVEGSVSRDDAVAAVHSGSTIDWWAGSDEENKINDLLRASIIGRGDFFSASDPATFSSELASMLEGFTADTSSATGVSFDMTTVESGDSPWAFTAAFQPSNWSGDVIARPVGTENGLSVGLGRSRTAASQLDNSSLSHNDREIITYDGSEGIPFTVSSLSAGQQADLTTAGTLADVVAYLRGDRSNEKPGGDFRARGSRLGDIVHSTPAYVGKPASNWPRTGTYDGYSAFVSDKSDRTPVIYAGSNDGMLHAFSAEEVAGANNQQDIDFTELFAYIPGFLYSETANEGLHYLADPNYDHKFYVDLPLRSVDVKVSGRSGVGTGTTDEAWRTVLIGGSRTGGKGIFALDVTDPAQFSEDEAGKLALWEFTHSELGYQVDAPIVSLARWGNNDVRWTAFFGNGYGGQTTGLYMLDIDGLVGSAPSAQGNNANMKFIELDNTGGLSSVAVLDLDGDGIANRVYAGDQEGNLWVVEESGNGSWASPHGQGSDSYPLFTATDASGNPQPITAAPRATYNPSTDDGGNEPNLLVTFGTGSYLYNSDPNDSQTQSFYGIWDNGNRITAARETALELRTMQNTTVDGVNARLSEGDDINFAEKQGWYVDLPIGFERIVTRSEIIGDFVFVSSMIPDVNPCVPGGRGWLMAFGLDGRTPVNRAFLELSDSVVGYEVPGIPSESGFIYLDGQLYRVTALSDGEVDVSEINYNLDDDSALGRKGWREMFE